MRISDNSAWQQPEIQAYLESTQTPMRLSTTKPDGFPLICSVWHYIENDYLYAVSHKDSLLVKTLLNQPKCAFDISTNEPPYKGIRGQGLADIQLDASHYLPKLIDKFLGQNFQDLQQFLMNRLDEERLIVININKISAWDFSGRMKLDKTN